MSVLNKAIDLDIDEIMAILTKPIYSRSYDDLLLLNAYFSNIDYIKKHLGNIPLKEMFELCRYFTAEIFESGDNIYHQGELGEKVYILLSGSCEVKVRYNIQLTKDEMEIREKSVSVFYDNDFIGESILESQEAYPKRINTVTSLKKSILLVISRESFLHTIKDSIRIDNKHHGDLKDSQKVSVSKDNLVRVLSKKRENRANHELEAAAIYLQSAIKFFDKFSIPQIVELCRVSESLALYNNSLLFRQGLVGQAFYAVLDGFVEVWRDDSSEHIESSNNLSSSKKKTNRNQEDLYSGLGKQINTFGPGWFFGEEVFTKSKSIREESYVTVDDYCEIIIIYKEDYQNLIKVIMNVDSMERLSLLRKTACFQTADVFYLNILAKAMEQRVYKMDEELYKSGDHVDEIIIIKAGECKVLANVREDSDKNRTGQFNNRSRSCTREDIDRHLSPMKETNNLLPEINNNKRSSISRLNNVETKSIEIGRIAPNSVLGLTMTLYDDITHCETVVASTIVVAFVISKHSYIHITKQFRVVIRKIIEEFKTPTLDLLWETAPRVIDEDKWRKEKSWDKFKDDIRNKRKVVDLLSNFRNLNNMTFEPVDYTHQESKPLTDVVTNNHNVVYETWGLKRVYSRDSNFKVTSPLKNKKTSKVMTNLAVGAISRNIRDKLNKKRSEIDSCDSVVDSKFNILDTLSLFSFETNILDDQPNGIQNQPFSLIHIHKQSLKDKSNSGLFESQRNVNCYFRVCCIGNNINDIKYFVDKYTENVYLTIFKGDSNKERDLIFKWKPYKSYDKMMLSDSDHFLIYCRNTPIEYASLDEPSGNLYIAPFPSICKDSTQKYACIVVNPIRPHGDSKLNKNVKDITEASGSDSSEQEEEEEVKDNKNSKKQLNRKKSIKKKREIAKPIQETVIPSSNCKLPFFLLEFSAVNEVIGTFPDRFDAIRYAINRFGYTPTVFQDRLLCDNQTPIKNSNKESFMLQKEKKIFIKDLINNLDDGHDRILFQIHKEEKSVCVVAMYEWILVNEPMLNKLNFLNVFDIPSEVDELFGNKIVTKKESPTAKDSLVKSFSEVGLSSNKSVSKKQNDYVNRFSFVATEPKNSTTKNPEAANQLVTSKSLHILENETQLKEFSKSVELLSKTNKSLVTTPIKKSISLNNTDDNWEEDINGKNQRTGAMLELRLGNLNAKLSDRKKIIDNNDYLCDFEHNSYKNYRYNSRLTSIASHMGGPPPLLKYNDSDPRMNFINQTLQIVESLQTIQLNKVDETAIKPQSNRNQKVISKSVDVLRPKLATGKVGTITDKLNILSTALKDKAQIN